MTSGGGAVGDERAALLAAAIAEPGDDTPRLVFADWLDEHGEGPRAELIRLQCRSDRLTADDPERRRLASAADRLVKKHRDEWLGPIAFFLPTNPGNPFDRGVLGLLEAGPEHLLYKKSKKALDHFPTLGIHLLRFDGVAERFREVAALPFLGWVSKLELCHHFASAAAMKQWVRSPHLHRLTSLTLTEPVCNDAGLTALAAADTLPNLRAFDIGSEEGTGRYTAAGVLAVLNGGRFPLLRRLTVSGPQPPKFSFAELVTDPGVRPLTDLWLGWDTPMAAVADSPTLTSLGRLKLTSSRIEDGDARRLLDNPTFGRLVRLEMTDMNAGGPRLSAATEARLRERFGDGLLLKYSQSR